MLVLEWRETAHADLLAIIDYISYQGPKKFTGKDASAVGRSKAKRQPTSRRVYVGCRFALDRPTLAKVFTQVNLFGPLYQTKTWMPLNV